MEWSTRELAELARTTVNTIRHYHHLGLLDEPMRNDNGYKKYGVEHLLRLLRIRRLVGVGVTLSQIGRDDMDGQGIQETLRQLDVEIVASIRRLRQARFDMFACLSDEAPAAFSEEGKLIRFFLRDSNRSILCSCGQIRDEQAGSTLQEM